MEITNFNTVPDDIKHLISHFLTDKASTNICAYYLRLLSNCMQRKFSMNEEYSLQILQKGLPLAGCERILNLYKRLITMNNITHRVEILYLLSELKEDESIAIPTKHLEVIGTANPDPLSESFLIEFTRDSLFAMQGIESRNFNYSEQYSSFVINSTVDAPLYETSLKLSELGWLFKKIMNFIQKSINSLASITMQSLAYSLKKEINQYYKFVAILNQSYDKNPTGVKKLWNQSQDALDKMRWLGILCDGVSGLKGGEILSALFCYWRNGNECLRSLLRPILEESAAPLLQMIRSWMLEGELFDTFHEFFVVQDFTAHRKKLWESMFKINTDMVPCFFSEDLVHKILLTGKSLYFLRKECYEEEWCESVSEVNSVLEIEKETSGGNWINRISQSTNEKLLNILFGKYRLQEHCVIVKKYLLMSQGDFHHALMEGIYLALSVPATRIYKHTLVSILETAVKSSNCQYHNSEFTNRVKVILEDTRGKQTGWDIFSLDYSIESPLSTFFSDEIMAKYRKIFNFLWKIKRAHYLMNSFQYPKELIKLQSIKKVYPQLKLIFLLGNQISHFINIFNNYLMVESIEGPWDKFYTKLTNAKDLDELISIHTKFIENALRDCFISVEDIFNQVLRILDIIIKFHMSRETFLLSVREEYNRLNSPLQEFYDEDDISRVSKESYDDLLTVAGIFTDEVIRFNTLLNDNDDLKLKNLVIILDFNDFYSYEILRKQGFNIEDGQFGGYQEIIQGLNDFSRKYY